MLYVGLDIHSKHISICVLDDCGKIVQRTQVRQRDELLSVLNGLPDRFEVCFEASTGYGLYYELLKPLASRVAVAHPGALAVIYRSKRKNDRHDAHELAKRLYLDDVPVVHVPSANVRAWRELIIFRRHLIQKRTRAKNGVRALLRTVGVKPPRRPGLWTREGQSWLKELAFSQTMHALKRDLLVEEIATLCQQVRRVECELKRFADQEPAVWQLRTIPGVGPRTAEAVVAFLDNPDRFGRSKAVGSYFGLVPSQDQSGDRNRLGHITRQGPPTVRHFLVEAAWQSLRRSPTVRTFFERIKRDDPARKKIALVATAHYLARVMWRMLRNGTLWREQPSLTAASVPWDPQAGGQARPTVPAAPFPDHTGRSPRPVLGIS